MLKKSLKIIFLSFFLCIQMPLWRLFVYAFNASSTEKFTGFSLKWFRVFWRNEQARDAFVNSFVLSFCSATLCILMALFFVYMSVMGRVRKVAFVQKIAQFLAIMPEMFMAVATFLIAVWVRDIVHYDFVGSYGAVVWVGALYFLGPAIYMIMSLTSSIAADVFEAAQDLGARSGYAFWRILVTMMFPALSGVWLAGVLWMMDDFLITLFLGGGRIMNMQSYIYFIEQGDPSTVVNVMACTSVILLLGIMALLYVFLQGTRKKLFSRW